MRRLLLLTMLLLLAAALPASAKMPPFEMTVEPRGDTIHVEVMVGRGDPLLVDSFDRPVWNGLIAVFPADHVDEEGRPMSVLDEGTAVPLSRVQAGAYQDRVTYQGSIALKPGHWAVVPFPSVTGPLRGTAEGWYSDTILVEITDERNAFWAMTAVGSAIAIAVGLRAVAGTRRV
ncbi:MAG: hypothetical protein ACFCU2_09155 [Acidimicrobiia bacterium]